ncbi:hypothetical protein SKAU_G00295240 [Synaphobranchus kaupii]|uniref:Atherin n=1 Tax=Synaphobranchus kaupii TaxID=118154 RepID=A0A9Q1EUM6_SYNKA|nr:hypothetical protein SKAU_G00295240 [Synaphobranchus kaupii]
MSEPMYRDWILETIDSLRSRKARPDLERICRMVRRRHGSDPERTRSELEKLIQEQTVLKVSYKGSISYRNAAKVQRKSRKKTEQSTGVVVKDQSKNTIFNNGDSAHSSTDQGETGDAEITNAILCRDPEPAPLPVAEAALVPNSGNSCPSVGTVVCRSQVHCATGSDEGLAKWNGVCLSSSAQAQTCNIKLAPVQIPAATCGRSRTRRSSQNPGRGATRSESESDQNISDLGDRLVDSVRSLLRRSRGVATLKGHAPLGLKEILGFLSSQERHQSQEKLTRNKVKVVLEKEVARGRLRRTRFGHITLPVRGVVGRSHARLLQSALQDRQTAKKEETGAVAMETGSGELSGPERRDCRPQSAGDQDVGAHGSTAPLCRRGGETDDRGGTGGQCGPREGPDVPGLLATGVSDSLTCSASPVPPPDPPTEPPSSCIGPEQEVCNTERSPTAHRCQQGDAAVPQVGIQSRALCPSVQREMANGQEEQRAEENAVTPDQLISDRRTSTQGELMIVTESGENVTSLPPDGCLGCKTEVGVASCLLTPTASPRDNGMGEEGGMKKGVFVKTEKAAQNPLEWSVSDVASYFIAAGFPEQAAAFRVQEIDGKSLLLMQRNDVLTGLSIRLGPALKIYEHHVKMLQKAHFEEDSAFC